MKQPSLALWECAVFKAPLVLSQVPQTLPKGCSPSHREPPCLRPHLHGTWSPAFTSAGRPLWGDPHSVLPHFSPVFPFRPDVQPRAFCSQIRHVHLPQHRGPVQGLAGAGGPGTAQGGSRALQPLWSLPESGPVSVDRPKTGPKPSRVPAGGRPLIKKACVHRRHDSGSVCTRVCVCVNLTRNTSAVLTACSGRRGLSRGDLRQQSAASPAPAACGERGAEGHEGGMLSAGVSPALAAPGA